MNTVEKRRKTPAEIVSNIFIATVFVLLALFVLFTLILLFWGLSISLRTYEDIYESKIGLPKGWPWEWEWRNYSAAFSDIGVRIPKQHRNAQLGELFYNTIIYSVSGALFSAFVPCVAAYVCAKFDYKFSRFIYALVVFTMALPIVGALPSQMQVMDTLRLHDTIHGVVIMQSGFAGMYFLVYYGVFKAYPQGYIEAAEIDGASDLKIFLKIVLPMVKTTFFTIALLRFIGLWNDYQTIMIFMPTYPTAAIGMYQFNFLGQNASLSSKISGSMLLILPIIVLFFVFHDKLMGNLTMGGMKE